MWNMNLSTSLNLERNLKIQKNGSSILEKKWYINGSVDPQENSAVLMADLNSGDVLTFLVNALGNGSSGAQLFEPHLTIFKVDDVGAHILQNRTVSEKLVADNYDLNTYSINTLSRQYDKYGDQVPFILGTRGPPSLRGRVNNSTEKAPRISTGKKKN